MHIMRGIVPVFGVITLSITLSGIQGRAAMTTYARSGSQNTEEVGREVGSAEEPRMPRESNSTYHPELLR